MKGHFKGTGSCPNHRERKRRVFKNVRHNYPAEKQTRVKSAFEGENKMAADCFLKELTWPDPLEPGHLLNG